MPLAELTDVGMYYEITGEGDPVLLIPGLGATCRMWDSVVPELAARFTVIAPDNRDVGKSIGKRKPRTMSNFAADLIELLDRLQLDRVHVIGISLGGVIATAGDRSPEPYRQAGTDFDRSSDRAVSARYLGDVGPQLTADALFAIPSHHGTARHRPDLLR